MKLISLLPLVYANERFTPKCESGDFIARDSKADTLGFGYSLDHEWGSCLMQERVAQRMFGFRVVSRRRIVSPDLTYKL